MKRALIFLTVLLCACSSAPAKTLQSTNIPTEDNFLQETTATLEATIAQTPTMTPSVLWISVPGFANETDIPTEYTCQNIDQIGISPEVDWGNLPSGTKSLALIADDPDAPLGTFTHWVVYNIPSAVEGLPQGMPVKEHIVGIGTQGVNGFGQNGYGGPCPPFKMKHRYYFRLYALDLPTSLNDGLDADGLRKQIESHVLGQVEWMGTYRQP